MVEMPQEWAFDSVPESLADSQSGNQGSQFCLTQATAVLEANPAARVMCPQPAGGSPDLKSDSRPGLAWAQQPATPSLPHVRDPPSDRMRKSHG